VEKRLKEGPGVTAQAPSATVVKQAPGSTVKRVSALKQLIILSRRSLNILVRDRASLALMILIAPLIGMMDFIMRESNPFATSGGSASQGMIMLFLMALICILVGAVASMREIVKEADIYRRERMVTLKIIPYVISKLWLGVLLAAYQSVVFILTKRLSAGWPDTRETIVLTFVTLFLATLSGILLGLLISAVSPNQNVAPLLLIMVLVPQFMFAGALMPLSTFGPAGKFIGYATSTKWGFESLVTISKLGKDVAEDPCWQLPKDKRDALLEKDKAKCTCMGSNLFKKCSFPSLADLYDPAVDTPEPVQPKALGNLPSQPPTCPAPPASQSAEAQSKYQQEMQDYQKAMEAYGKDMEAYKESVNKYQNDMDTWRVRYQDWKAKHDRAIAEGEGLIKKIYEDFGFMFKVNLATHWGWLGGITVVVFALVLLVQKRKDVV
jgi:ABC-type proline/glycine betaine transport system permease subunit